MSADAPTKKPFFDRTLNITGLLAILAGVLTAAGSVLAVRDGLAQAVNEVRSKNESQDMRITALERWIERSQDEETRFRDQLRVKIEEQARDMSSVLRSVSVIEERTRVGRR